MAEGKTNFYNPKMSMLSLGVSLLRGTIQVNMSKSLNPGMTGRPSKGQKVYDHDNAAYFSLSPEECQQIIEAWNPLLQGTFVNHAEKNEKYKNSLSVTHFRNNQPSRLVLARSKDQQGNPAGTLIVSIFPPQGEGTPVSYVFRKNELNRCAAYIKHGAYDLDFYKDIYEGMKKAQKQEEWKNNNQQGGNGQNNNQQQNQGGGQNQYDGGGYGGGDNNDTGATFDDQDKGQQTQQNQQNQGGEQPDSVSNVDEMDFSF
ncbi:MAG: hypothetical protein KAS32_06730 [Candidatus Peribacteraceae bacterium]|nr:hypothetical protein [Candidatus Peribacteraceae bacterium]